jgi:hypothetical protein
VDREGVHTLWTLSDARESVFSKRMPKTIVIGSFVGIQAVDALIESGLRITVVDIWITSCPEASTGFSQ